MDMQAFIFVSILLTWPNVLSTNKHGHIFQRNFWQNLAPGELLNELDFLTTNELQNRRYFKPLIAAEKEIKIAKPTTKQAKLKNKNIKPTPNRRITEPEDDSAASTSASVEQDDYERTYEEFVNSYFNDAADHYLSNNEDEDEVDLANTSVSQDASNLSGSIESDIVAPFDAQPFETSPKAAKSAKKKCRKVRKKREICLICKNQRTNEHSETCSYEHSSVPETYAHETKQKFRKSRDSESTDNDDDNDGAENDSAEYVAESKLLAQAVKPLAAINETNFNENPLNSSCIRRTSGDKVCYYCRNTLGELKVNCLASKPLEQFVPNSKNKPVDENSHKKRRIFKRTLSYVFEKGLDSNGTFDLPNELNQNSTEYLN